MAKAAKKATKQPVKYKEKVKLNVGFHDAMKILADHANDLGKKKTTYKNRRKASE